MNWLLKQEKNSGFNGTEKRLLGYGKRLRSQPSFADPPNN